VRTFLSASGDPPFIPDAAPALTTTALPTSVKAGKSFTIEGTLTNVVPGTPPLSGVRVSLQRVVKTKSGPTRITVASDTTGSTGHYSISYQPRQSQAYWLDVAPITKVEDPKLSPVFGDLLAPTAKWLGRIAVSVDAAGPARPASPDGRR
jgi:hypothetical protein